MISLRPNSIGFRLLSALVANPGSTPEELARDVVTFPTLTWEQATGPGRLRLLRERQAERSRAAGLVRRLQETGVVETRGKMRLSAEWLDLLTRHSPAIALRIMSGLTVSTADAGPYLDVLALVANPAHHARFQDSRAGRWLVRWGVVVAPAARWPTEKGRKMVEGVP